MKKRMFGLCLALTILLAAPGVEAWVGNVELLDSAKPQECYVDIGVRVAPTSTDPFTCPEGSLPYTPQTYTWSMAVVPADQGPADKGEQVWFGTGGNVLCTTQGSLVDRTDSSEGRASVCEFGESSQKQKFPGLPDQWGDWYPPNFYQYDVTTRTKIDRTPYTDPLRNRCAGLRSAGYHNGVVFLAGGSLGGGINMFAFNATTGAFLGSRSYTQYRTIRKWVVVGNQLYTGVGTTYYGRILRWTGSVTNPFSFTEVGILEGVPRELTGYVDSAGRNRLAVNAKSVFVSPAIPSGGLTTTHRNRWIEAWSPDEYEPDFTTRTTYVGGGIGFLNGWLYFGTMHIPGNAEALHQTCEIVSGSYTYNIPSSLCFGDTGDDYASSYKRSAIYLGASRATSIWRIRNPESTSRETQLLYGEQNLRSYNSNYPDPPAEGATSEEWEAWMEQVFPETPNVGGYIPLLGTSGFNNACNNYSWVMQTVGNNLFTGTMDYCSMGSTSTTAGADLWRIGSDIPDVIDPADPNKYQAVAETTRAFKCGAGDICQPCLDKVYSYSPYGFRTLQPSGDGTKLYAGTATGVNVGAVDDGAGYQLLLLDSVAPTPTWYYDGDGDGYGLSDDSVQDDEAPAGYVSLSCDCNDDPENGGALVNPGATEICGNGIDDDCDGSIDECRTYYLDADADSWGTNSSTVVALSRPEGYDSSGGDCNDADPAINPGETEICGNGVDENCDGVDDVCAAVPE